VSKKSLTKSDYQKLSLELVGTQKNVYPLSLTLFQYEFKDKDLDKLESLFGLRRCVECGTWVDTPKPDTHPDACDECASKIDS
jgi:hypothetical protein